MKRLIIAVSIAGLIAGLIAACSGRSDKPQPPPEPAPIPAKPVEHVEPAPAKPVYTAEQKRRYRKHLSAGRKLSDQRKWGEAAREFEQALEAIPMDGRALSELGWSAFQAGDYDRARSANQDSVRAATESNVRAASLYNLGRVAEATGNRDEAAQHYRASLKLRPNKIVENRLRGLDQPVPAPAEPAYVPCGPSESTDALCRCIMEKTRPVDDDTELACHREPRQVAGVELLFVGDDTEEWVHLISEVPGKAPGKSGGEPRWSSVAMLGYVYSPDDFGIQEEFEIARFETRMIGERKALWIETSQTRSDADTVLGVTESSEVRTLTVCSWDASKAFGCSLQVPLVAIYDRARLPEAEPEAETAPDTAPPTTNKSRGDPSAPLHTVRRVKVKVRDNGTAKVVLVEGDKTDVVAPILGEHKLW